MKAIDAFSYYSPVPKLFFQLFVKINTKWQGELNYMYHIKKSLVILVFCTSILTMVNCSKTKSIKSTGFGVWADDCSGIAVAVNKNDYESGLLHDHSTNARYDLHLCNTNGDIVKTLFSERKIDGNPSEIDSLAFDNSRGYILIYSHTWNKQSEIKEKINLSDLTTEVLEEINIKNWPGSSRQDAPSRCGGKSIQWNTIRDWIEVQ